jgi:hypothetical protein
MAFGGVKIETAKGDRRGGVHIVVVLQALLDKTEGHSLAIQYNEKGDAHL